MGDARREHTAGHTVLDDRAVDRGLAPIERVVGVVEALIPDPDRPELVEDAGLVTRDTAGGARADRREHPSDR